MRRFLITTASIAALTSFSFAQTPSSPVVPANPAATPAGAVVGAPQPGAMANVQLAPEDVQFVKMAASGGLYEVQSSQLATTASETAEVKAFAQQMIQDHTAASQVLKGLAQQKGISLSPAMALKHQKMFDKLKDAKGEEFDKLYGKQQARAHEEAVALFEKTAAGSNDPDLKGFATQTLPKLKQHLEQAKSLPGNE